MKDMLLLDWFLQVNVKASQNQNHYQNFPWKKKPLAISVAGTKIQL